MMYEKKESSKRALIIKIIRKTILQVLIFAFAVIPMIQNFSVDIEDIKTAEITVDKVIYSSKANDTYILSGDEKYLVYNWDGYSDEEIYNKVKSLQGKTVKISYYDRDGHFWLRKLAITIETETENMGSLDEYFSDRIPAALCFAFFILLFESVMFLRWLFSKRSERKRMLEYEKSSMSKSEERKKEKNEKDAT